MDRTSGASPLACGAIDSLAGIHVGLNLIYLVPGETGGMETYARELTHAMASAAPPGMRLTAFVGREAAAEDLGVETVVVPVAASNRVQWVRGEQILLPRMARVDLVHSLGSTAPAWGRFRRVVTIHDLHYRTVPEAHFGLRAQGMRVLVPLAARRADRVIAVSRAARDDIVKFLHVAPERIDVVPHGFGAHPVDPLPEAEVRARLNLGDRPVVLSVSAKRPHKNLERLLRAHRTKGPGPFVRSVLVLPGYPTEHEAELRALADSLGIAGDVRFPGWLPAAELEGLYAIASAFVFPSLAEGFGLPVLEAMARGVPVACSGTGAVAEVAGDAALLFDPLDPESIAEATGRLLSEPALAERLREAGRARAARFTWRAAAEGTLASYARALAA